MRVREKEMIEMIEARENKKKENTILYRMRGEGTILSEELHYIIQSSLQCDSIFGKRITTS